MTTGETSRSQFEPSLAGLAAGYIPARRARGARRMRLRETKAECALAQNLPRKTRRAGGRISWGELGKNRQKRVDSFARANVGVQTTMETREERKREASHCLPTSIRGLIS